MIPYEVFCMFFVGELVFLYAAFLHEDNGYWESPLFSFLSVIQCFMLAFWCFDGINVDGANWTNGWAAMFIAVIALLSLINFVDRVIDGFGKNIQINKIMERIE